MNLYTNKRIHIQNKDQFLAECNEKLVYAARDLAHFTQHGIYAGFISELALKCEAYESALYEPAAHTKRNRLEKEILDGLSKICKTGQKIWNSTPHKYRQYNSSLIQTPVSPYQSVFTETS